jgi:phosphatidylglycerol:prolipoprotein diacylglycerol transferase
MDFQEFKLLFFSALFRFAANELMMVISFVIALIIFLRVSQGLKSKCKITLVLVATAIASFWGARLLHVIIERPELFHQPHLIYSRFDGMTFNGSILFGAIAFWLGLRLFEEQKCAEYWDQAALVTACSYGLMRIGCFSAGCCWGKPTSVPWSVKYSQSIFMPWLGIPVHPVQLYDAFLGFALFAALYILKTRFEHPRGKLFGVFLGLYSIGRFYTEFFRGDTIRGEDLVLGLSTSQIVSISILIVLGIRLIGFKRISASSGIVALILASLILTGCLPAAPSDQEFKSILRADVFETYQTKKSIAQARKNVLFIASDQTIQVGFADILKAAYKAESAPLLEDLVFWEYVHDLKRIYNVIVRIPPGKVGFEAVSSALADMESLGDPYDLILLTHGFPNHLSTGNGYFFSYRELGDLKGKLNHLNLVMLQSCYGTSLVQDFKEAGAKHVMSYPGLNRNFFFLGFFLKYYDPDKTAQATWELARNSFDFQMRTLPYVQIANILVSRQNASLIKQGLPKIELNDFIAAMPAPSLD